jgi:hypothetical protein
MPRQRSFVSNKIIHMTRPRTRASALDEFLPEVDFRASRNVHVDPREIYLEPLGAGPQPVEAPLAPIMVESSKTAQFWPMLAAALVGIGTTILGLAAFSRFAQ